MKRILLIEDEKNLVRFIQLELEHELFEVHAAYDGKAGLELALQAEWDLILLDLMLPGLNGIEVCRQIRAAKKTPVLMLTARDSVVDRVSGLDSGADDYMPKPFAFEELLARIRAIFRRMELERNDPHEMLSFQNITVDVDARIVYKDQQIVALTKREFDLLVMFMKNHHLVLTRDMLLDQVWGYDSLVETNVVDVYVRYLRNKLGNNGESNLIQTIRGIGYVMR